MSQRLFALPLMVAAVVQMAMLWRASPAWFAAQIAQWLVVLLAAAGAWYFHDDLTWVFLAWGLFGLFVWAPAWMNRRAVRWQAGGLWSRVFWWRRLTGCLTWGHTGRVYRLWTRMLRHATEMKFGEAEELLASDHMMRWPEQARGSFHLMRLWVAYMKQDWEAGLRLIRSGEGGWGGGPNETVAALLSARILAENGRVTEAMGMVRMVMEAPERLQGMALPVWQARLAVAALAGDEEEVERLAGRRDPVLMFPGRDRVLAYWRARCASARGRAVEAERWVDQAKAMTQPDEWLWSSILDRAGRCDGQSDTMVNAGYQSARDSLRKRDNAVARWQMLTQFGQFEPSVAMLLVVLAVMFVADEYVLRAALREVWWQWASNASETIVNGQWWRAFTALLVHAGPAHFAVNMVALWWIGPVVACPLGWWRTWLVFFVGGALGNVFSAAGNLMQVSTDRYDLSVGASGGVFALLGAYAGVLMRFQEPGYERLRWRVLVLVGLLLAADFVTRWIEPRVDWMAHAGGFVSGLIMAIVLMGRKKRWIGELGV